MYFWEIIMAYPPEYKYTREHEWLAVEGTTGTIGITDYAQNSLGDIVFVELPKVGAVLEAGKTFGTVESVKAVSDLYAPVTGTVTAINETLATSPEKVNSEPHTAWMVKVTLANPAEVEALLTAADYEKFVAEEQ
jgi:glycine cleavage system H protein